MSARRQPRFSNQDYEDILAYRSHLRRFLAWSEAQAKQVGLTPAQHQLLLAVRGHPGPEPPMIREIAAYLGLRHHSAVGLVTRAEAAGLVLRVHDTHDGRVVRVALDPAGEAALEHLTAIHVIELGVLADATRDLRVPPSATASSGPLKTW